MEKLIAAIVLVFSMFNAQAQLSKVNEFVNSLPKNQEGIKIFRFNASNINDVANLKKENLLIDVKQFLPDSLLKDIQDITICQLGSKQVNESKSLEGAIKKADLKTIYAMENEGMSIQVLASNFENNNAQDLLVDIKSEDYSRVTVMLKGNLPLDLSTRQN